METQRAAGEPTMGGAIAEERATNVFLRADQPTVVTAVQREEPPATDAAVDVFAALRRWKDRF